MLYATYKSVVSDFIRIAKCDYFYAKCCMILRESLLKLDSLVLGGRDNCRVGLDWVERSVLHS